MHQAVVKGGRNEFKRGRKNQVNLRMICVKNCLKSREYSYSSKLDFWKKSFNAAYTPGHRQATVWEATRRATPRSRLHPLADCRDRSQHRISLWPQPD